MADGADASVEGLEADGALKWRICWLGSLKRNYVGFYRGLPVAHLEPLTGDCVGVGKCGRKERMEGILSSETFPSDNCGLCLKINLPRRHLFMHGRFVLLGSQHPSQKTHAAT